MMKGIYIIQKRVRPLLNIYLAIKSTFQQILLFQNWSTLAAVRAFLTFTSVRELGLSNCRLHLPSTKLETVPPQTYECPSIVVLKLAGAQVINYAQNCVLKKLYYLCT